MVGSFSPHHEAGGTCHALSPTHLHSINPTSAFRELRRSLSRSPSKGPAFRMMLTNSGSSSPKSPLSPSPEPGQAAHFFPSAFSPPQPTSPSPLGFPHAPPSRKTRQLSRRPSPMRNSSRASSTQLSPRKRTLRESADNGNATPQSSLGSSSDDQENDESVKGHVSPLPSTRQPGHLKASAPALQGNPFSAPRATARFEKGYSSWSAKSSPLKRSDGIMNFDQAHGGSPSAKRRSLHGGIFGPDFNIFDSEAGLESQDTPMTGSDCGGDLSTSMEFLSPLPKRTSSLRKTTLQQRHDKPLFTKPRSSPVSVQDAATPSTHAPKSGKFRASLDSSMLPLPRDSPFSSQGALPSASAHPIAQQSGKPPGFGPPMQFQRHPLSRTISQSTSSSSVAEDSPTHIPIRQPEHRRPFVDFSKSLPLGVTRPGSEEGTGFSQETEGSFSTPENYKLVKPLPAAFMSTGLISKRHKHVEDDAQPAFNASTSTMPDTPCKRHSAADVPSPTAPLHDLAPRGHVRHSFGTPSTPFNPYISRAAPEGFGNGVSVFGSAFHGGPQRETSFGQDDVLSPSRNDSQSSAEFDIPPTPTKQSLDNKILSKTPESYNNFNRGLSGRNGSINGQQVPSLQQQNSSPLGTQILRLSPRTPRDNVVPPDPSSLSISVHTNEREQLSHGSGGKPVPSFPPATPTAPRGSLASFNRSHASVTPSHTPGVIEVDPSLTSKFDKVELIGVGEFSQVYRVSKAQELRKARSYFSLPLGRGSPKTPLPDRIWAVKRSRTPYIGPKDRQRKLQEVNALKALGQSDHVLELCDNWEDRNHLYIQTEFCEEGSLDSFLDQVGRRARLDDFRIWKILLEVSLGIKHIHDSGFIHLDLKPANILITFEGVLKIADFGMATSWPAPPGIDGEGDREYIGPEILRGQFDKPADVFALGLIVLEIAGNVMLPDNGASWQRLRSGDMSDVPSLTWSSDSSGVLRDSTGNPLSQTGSIEDLYDSGSEEFSSPRPVHSHRRRTGSQSQPQLHRPGELATPPAFMCDQNNPEALDKVVRWMISPSAADRPMIDQVLSTMGVQWALSRRRAGATIFEGNWGPADEVLADDSEMIDV